MSSTVLVTFGQHTRPVSFDHESGYTSLLQKIQSTFNTSSERLIIQIKDENWGGLYIDLLPSQDIPDRSVLKVLVDESTTIATKVGSNFKISYISYHLVVVASHIICLGYGSDIYSKLLN